MSFLLKNKSPSSTANLTKKQPLQAKQVKKKTCIIKLEVNKLFKPQFQKQNFNKNTKIEHANSHQTYEMIREHHKSLQKQVESKSEKKIIKTFEELYFEKIKQIKLQQNLFIPFSNHEQKVILAQKIRPSSCKNIVSIKVKNKSNFTEPCSSKNSTSEENKQNVFIQKSGGLTINHNDGKFFKKKDTKIAELDYNHQRILSSSLQKVSQKRPIKKEEDFQDQKVRKILKIRRPSKLSKEEPFEKLENNFFERPSIQKPSNIVLDVKKQVEFAQKLAQSEQKTVFSPMNSCLNPSLELKTFKLTTPLSSAQKPMQLSLTETRFDEIIRTKINHSKHEHIWDGIECFFSFQEFQLVLLQLGFEESFQNKEITFYVNKLWEHLGGDIYGGVVRKNMRDFLNIVLEDDCEISRESAQSLTSKEEQLIVQNFIDKGSLKLVNLSQIVKEQLKRFYFPLRMSKIASQIHHLKIKENSGEKLHNSINSIENFSNKSKNKLSSQKPTSSNRSNLSNLPQPKQVYLQNNAYLDTISVKNRHQDLSPCMIPRNYDNLNDINFITDFSPKMPPQKYEPFKSTILSKDDFVLEKLSTQQQEEHEADQKVIRKPLLSVDVNLGEGVLEKLLVYEDENPYEISLQLKEKYNIDEQLREKFEKMLRNHLNTLLFKIEEVSEELFEDSVELKDQNDIKDFVLMEKQ